MGESFKEAKVNIKASLRKLDWEVQGACRGEDPDLFYKFDGERSNGLALKRREAAAKAICAGCPVLAECLDYSLVVREPHGLWGGLNEDERKSLLAEKLEDRTAKEQAVTEQQQQHAVEEIINDEAEVA